LPNIQNALHPIGLLPIYHKEKDFNKKYCCFIKMDFFDIQKEKIITYNLQHEKIYFNTQKYYNYIKYRDVLINKINILNDRIQEIINYENQYRNKIILYVDESKQLSHLNSMVQELSEDLEYIDSKLADLEIDENVYQKYIENLKILSQI
jgi:hypothetical protein